MITHAMEGFSVEKMASYQKLKSLFCSLSNVREIFDWIKGRNLSEVCRELSTR